MPANSQGLTPDSSCGVGTLGRVGAINTGSTPSAVSDDAAENVVSPSAPMYSKEIDTSSQAVSRMV